MTELSFERPNLQYSRRLNEFLSIHGPSHVLDSSGQDLKSPRPRNQATYEPVYLCSTKKFQLFSSSSMRFSFFSGDNRG
jgi:hypothetical protein